MEWNSPSWRFELQPFLFVANQFRISFGMVELDSIILVFIILFFEGAVGVGHCISQGRDKKRQKADTLDRSIGNWVCVLTFDLFRFIKRQHGCIGFPSFYFTFFLNIFSFFSLSLFFCVYTHVCVYCLRGFTVGRDVNEPFPVPTPPPLLLARHLRQDRIHSVRVLESIKCIFNRTTLKHTLDTHHSIQELHHLLSRPIFLLSTPPRPC